jgi:hypothetical protein
MPEHDEGAQSDIDQTKTQRGLRKIRTGSDSDQPKTQLTKNCSLTQPFEVNPLAGRYHHPTRAARVGTPVRSQF